MIGKSLAQYEIRDLLGKGGMGEVYRALDTKLGREVALKLLPPGFAADPDRLHRFEREARALAALSHRNIATIHGFEQDGEHRFLVLELVEGENLAERLAHERPSTPQVLNIARQIAEGMEAAHEKGIIHRDLKPANIKVSGDGSVKILDFGLARVDEALASPANIADSPTVTLETSEGTLLGTAPYMSPEQLKGQPVDPRTDIWAFGCVLYEMLTGVSPFWANSAPEIMARALDHEPDWSGLPKNLPVSVARLVRRCLAKDPRHRLHSAADIRIVLQEAIEAGPETAATELSPPRRSILRTALVAVAAFALGALAVDLLAPVPDTVSEPARSTTGPVRLMIPVRDDAAVVPLPESPSVAISPDGRDMVYVASVAESGRIAHGFAKTQLFGRPLDGFEARPIVGTGGASGPFFSPDGEWIGYFQFQDGVLRKIRREGGPPIDLCFVNALTLRGACWGTDGRIYFSDSTDLFVVDEDGGDAQRVAGPDAEAGEKTYRCPDLIPGTRKLLFVRGSSEIMSYDDGEIALLDLDSGEVRVLVRGGMDPLFLSTGHILYGRGGKAYAVPFDLERLEVTGSPVEVLDGVVTSDGYGAVQLSVSRNGTLVYVAGGPEQFSSQLLILDRDGQIENVPQPPRAYGNVKLSPDANRVLLSVLGANASVWIYDLGRGTMTKLISGWDNYSPVWDASGTLVAFGSNRSGENAVWITSAEGTGSPTMLRPDPSHFYPSSWSPGGDHIVVSGLSPSTGLDIWLVSRDGSTSPAIHSPAREQLATFSPEGRYLAYTSDESGQIEVYVQAFPITGRKWKLSEDGGELPTWSTEGDAIYYWSEHRLMMVPIEREPDFRPARAQLVLEADIEVHDFDVFPGAERFVVLGRASMPGRAALSIARGSAQGRLFPSQSPDLHVVLNWFDDVTRLAPPK